jgi:hypothetical protein
MNHLDDAAFDALFQKLPKLEPSLELEEAVLEGYQQLKQEEAARRQARNLRFGLLGAAALLAAGLAIAILPEQQEVGDPSLMTPRGEATVNPTLRLELGIAEGSRLNTTTNYPAGTTIVFRVVASKAGPYRLSRNGKLIAEGQLMEGANLLSIGYQLEEGEGAAVFVVESSGVQAEAYTAAPARRAP